MDCWSDFELRYRFSERLPSFFGDLKQLVGDYALPRANMSNVKLYWEITAMIVGKRST